jgi:hypothetical protein
LLELETWIGDVGYDRAGINGHGEIRIQVAIMRSVASIVFLRAGAPKWTPRDAGQGRHRCGAIDGHPFRGGGYPVPRM